MNLEINSEKIIEASKTSKTAKKLLKSLFPEVFIADEPFINVGQLFLRKFSPNSIYTVQLKNDKVCILNITSNLYWDNKLFKSELINDDSLTEKEFLKLVSNEDMTNFVIVEKEYLKKLFNQEKINKK